jgi:hypothetical protein
MNFHFKEALDVLLKTTPYLLVRVAIYAVLGVAGALLIGLLVLLGKVFGGGGVIFFLIGIALLIGPMPVTLR